MVSENIIEIQDLWHTYDSGVTALQGVNLTIHPGEFVAFVGANGSGKTTLVKHLNGLLRPTEGNILINGINTRDVSVGYLAKTVGFVFQNPDHQIFCYSVWEETLFGLKQLRLPKDEVEDRAEKALKIVGLFDRRDRHPRELSRGQRQRLATASVLALETEVLVLDEPTTGQDFLARRQIMNLAMDLNKKGRTIVIITHDMALVAEYATRVLVMHHGKLDFDGTPRQLFTNDELLLHNSLRLPPIVELARGVCLNGKPINAFTRDDFLGKLSQILVTTNNDNLSE